MENKYQMQLLDRPCNLNQITQDPGDRFGTSLSWVHKTQEIALGITVMSVGISGAYTQQQYVYSETYQI